MTQPEINDHELITGRVLPFESPDDLARVADAYGASDGQLLALARLAEFLSTRAVQNP